ncbi:hypothetical protein [Rickettsia gravesii]|uniref:hypothetical protein n=1 Tax=Rickettsia gravesii TaxID=354585 RepID=UPI0004B41DB3|nr:hypothetical protein [Rickettsia gravesii]
MSKFKVTKPINYFNTDTNIKVQSFASGADSHSVSNFELDKHAKATKSFTIPLNEYELAVLKTVASKLDRSQRYVARRFLIKALLEEVNL